MKFHFDILAPVYELILGNEISSAFMELLDLHEDYQVLEVGAGTGRISQNLIDTVQSVWIVDPSVKMLQEARNRYPRLKVLKSYAEDLPFPANCFDLVISYDSFHHWDHHQTAINELYRVTKAGGRCIIAEINPLHRRGYFIKLMEEVFRMKSIFFSPKDLETQLYVAGFEMVKSGWINPPTYYSLAKKPAM